MYQTKLSAHLIFTSQISHRYSKSKEIKFPDINLESNANLLILGQSGTGKTTLLHLLAGILKLQKGELEIDSNDIGKMSPKELDAFRGKHIGLVFQKSYFVKSISIKDNLILAQKLANQKKDIDQIKDILERLNILDKMDKLANELSVGEQQRASIARAIINKPSLILADEPTSALDDENADNVINLLLDSAEKCNANLVVVTHDRRLISKLPNTMQL